MSVSSTTSRVAYTGNGSTSVYSYGCRINASTDLRVTVRLIAAPYTETTLVLTTDYTVDGIRNSLGNITLVNASQAWLTSGNLKNTYKIIIRRVPPLTQTTITRNQSTFYGDIHEDRFDKLVMSDQALRDDVDRSMKLPETYTSSDYSPTIPAAIIGVPNVSMINNSDGTGLVVGPTADQISTAQTSATNAAASATAASASATSASASATSATSSASTATTQASAASTSASSASTSASAASTSASGASTSATNAATSATGASTSATNAAASATSASTSAGTATTQASAASVSATGAATSATNAAASEVQAASDGSAILFRWGGSAGGTADALTITPSPAISAYATGQRFAFLATATNATTTPTVNVNSKGAKTLVKTDGTALVAGSVTSGTMYSITYDGTSFRVHELVSVADGSVTALKLASGSYAAPGLVSKSGTYSATSSDDVILVDGSGGAFSVTLPTAVGIKGKKYQIKRIDLTLANAVTIATTSSQTIDGITTRKLCTQYEQFTVISDGANWQISSHSYPSLSVAYVPTFVGLGTVTSITAWSLRIGDQLEVWGSGSAGTAIATNVQIGLGYGGVANNVTVDTSKFTAGGYAGNLSVNLSTSTIFNWSVLAPTTNQTFVNVGKQSSTGNMQIPDTGLNTIGTGGFFEYRFRVPIVGWEG